MRPRELKYTREHEWIRVEDGVGTVGITDFAASELGDIVYIELPEEGTQLSAGDSMGTIETVKAVEEIYAPVTGLVVEVNHTLDGAPESVNQDPFGEGWLVRIEVDASAEAELISVDEYDAILGEDG